MKQLHLYASVLAPEALQYVLMLSARMYLRTGCIQSSHSYEYWNAVELRDKLIRLRWSEVKGQGH